MLPRAEKLAEDSCQYADLTVNRPLESGVQTNLSATPGGGILI